MLGWRTLTVTDDGRLRSLNTSAGFLFWSPTTDLTATCAQPYWAPTAAAETPHRAPDPTCTCGLRLMTDLPALLHHVEQTPERFGLDPEIWSDISDDYHQDRQRWGVTYLPDAIAEVEASGRHVPGARTDIEGNVLGDPPSTIRAERARLASTVYISPHLAHMATLIKGRHPTVELVAYTGHPSQWLDAINTERSAR